MSASYCTASRTNEGESGGVTITGRQCTRSVQVAVVTACVWLDLLPDRKKEKLQPRHRCREKYPAEAGTGLRWPSVGNVLCRGRGGWRVRRGGVSSRWRREPESGRGPKCCPAMCRAEW